MEFRLKALTPVWTGGVERNDNSILHLTGIKGSIRWWYEVLIRGLDYYACDPTANKRDQATVEHCELNLKKLDRDQPLAREVKKQICPACYMFGCTGWSGKFILKLTEPETDRTIKSLSSREIAFKLHFLEQKKIDHEEELLLKMTLKLIVDYGAIGGKTIFKPSEIKHKNTKLHHRDFGILARDKQSKLPTEKIRTEEIIQYLKKFEKKEKKEVKWPNMKYFWFVKGKHIDRLQHNRLVGRDTNNGNYQETVNEDDVFLGGFISKEKGRFNQELKAQDKDTNAASKKIFSFIGTGDKNCPIKRCFGYVRADGSLVSFIDNLDFSQLPFQKNDIIKGYDLINNL